MVPPVYGSTARSTAGSISATGGGWADSAASSSVKRWTRSLVGMVSCAPAAPEEAQRHWLGVSIDNEGPDLHVVGYAVDGRPEPKVDTAPQVKSVSQLTSDAAFKLGMGPSNAVYDDYESPEEEPTTSTSENFQRVLETSTDFAKKATSSAGSFLRNAADKARDYIADRRNR